MSVGVFGGAFNPPHLGHVELARRGIERFDLDRLLVRVVEDPGHKDVGTAPQIRLFLAELAFAPLDEAELSLDPFPRTVDSLEALALDDPVFLVGADEFASFLTWKEPERVLELARLGVGSPAGGGPGRPADHLARRETPPRPVRASAARASTTCSRGSNAPSGSHSSRSSSCPSRRPTSASVSRPATRSPASSRLPSRPR